MNIIASSKSEKAVLVQKEDGTLSLWTPTEYSGEYAKVFDIKGTKVLLSENHRWWSSHKKDAKYCEYYQQWWGEFPYGSWSWAIRLCKVTGKVQVAYIETEINGRGINPSDEWASDCRSYVPESIKAEVLCAAS